MVKPQRGDLYWVKLDPTLGTEIRKQRPAVIVSNDAANRRYHQVTVLPLTSQQLNRIEPFQVLIRSNESGLNKDSKALAEQIRTISKLRLGSRISQVSQERLAEIDAAIRIHLALE